jgi:spermidine synthase
VSTLHWALFTYSCHLYATFSEQKGASAGRVYGYETAGMVVGGIATTYLLIPYLDTFQVSAGLALLNSAICLILLAPQRHIGRSQKTAVMITGLATLLFLALTSQAHNLHGISIQAQWKNLDVVHYQNSQYGNITVIENEGQYIFFQDGEANIITPIPDIPAVEEFVHLPLLAHPNPQKILILSGGAGGVINEALKHPYLESIDYAELDPLIIDLFRKFPTPLTDTELNDSRVKINHIDGRLFLARTGNQYDLIFVGMTDPSNLQTNRFYTKEFFSLTKEKLTQGGILVLRIPGSLSYTNQELQNLNSSLFFTMEEIFPYVRVIPGYGTNQFLLSESEEILDLDTTQIIKKLNQREITDDVVIPWHIEAKLNPEWGDWFNDFIRGRSQKINSDFRPIGVYYSIAYWNALFAPSLRGLFQQIEGINLKVILLGFIILFLIYVLLRSKKSRLMQLDIPFSIFTTGFAGMVFDLTIIFTFQSLYGHAFSWIGLLVAAFMAGAGCGALLITQVIDRVKDLKQCFGRIDIGIMVFSLGFLLIVLVPNTYLGTSEGYFLFRAVFLVLSFISGLLIGSQFPLGNALYLKEKGSLSRTAGSIYAADLLGGWLGGILGAVLLLPILGLVGTCITLGLLKLLSYVVIRTTPG